MSLSFRPTQKARPTHKQQLALKNIIGLYQRLKDPCVAKASIGLEGLRIGDAILKQRQAIGVVIGGLMSEIWNEKSTEESFNSHKDTDIAVLSDNFEPETTFEGGIDWWIPSIRNVNIRSDYSNYTTSMQIWQNGNEVNLFCGFTLFPYDFAKLPAGLYLPARQLVIDYRVAIMSAMLDERIQQEEDIEELLQNRIERETRKRISTQVRKHYPVIKDCAVSIKPFERAAVLALGQKESG